jgi:hypothetical protein
MSISKTDLEKINRVVGSDVEVKMFDQKKISELTVGEAYIIEKIHSFNTRFGKAVIVRLYDKSANNIFESFLPKRVAETLSDEDMSCINQSMGKYTLTYLGQGSRVFYGHTRSLLKFSCLE